MIKELSDEMNQFLSDIKKNIKDPETKLYLVNRIEKLYDAIFKNLEEIVDYKEDKIKQMEIRQEKNSKKLEEMENKLENLSSEFYEEDAVFEIVCPYCNSEFDVNIDKNSNEIVCPECNNIIELDWNDEDENGEYGE